MKKLLAAFTMITCLVGASAGCRSEPAPGVAAELRAPELSTCCQAAMELVARMDECCRTGISTAGEMSGCCEEGMADATPDADRPDCCKRGRALLNQTKACCRETITSGDADACCSSMPAALESQATN